MTQTTTETYTSQEGEVRYNGNYVGTVAFEATVTRDVIEIGRAGKYSDLVKPGKVSFSGKVQYGLVTGEFMRDVMDDGTNTSSTGDETLHASVAGSGALQTITSAITDPTTPRPIKITTATTDTLTPDAITVYGTDKDDKPIVEAISYTDSPGSFYGSLPFKTVSHYTVPASMDANDSVTLLGTGLTTTTLGKPKYFTITAKLFPKVGSKYILLTLNNVFFTNFPLILGSASDAVLPEQEIAVQDPDVDIILSELV